MHESTYSTEFFCKNLWFKMAEDFRNSLQDPDFVKEPEQLLRSGSIVEFRSFKYPRRFLRPYYYFKAEYQMENLFKRFRFSSDLYTDKELQEITIQKFKDTQIQINGFDYPTRTLRVLKVARKIVKEILGSFDKTELLDLCKHGSRASVGIPLRDAYIDKKFVNALSGSCDQIDWFKKTYLPQDEVLVALYQTIKKEPVYKVCSNLVQTCVPKSYKAFRSICPNTTIGAFRTYGLGQMIRMRIEKIGLNLSTLPERHKRLAKQFSKSRTGATADLSSASDSFSPWLVNRLIPRDWYRELKLGRIPYVKNRNEVNYLNSFMTMGIGFTFPLQTLLFYAILKGIQALTAIPGTISVFGDDLIYPSKMHNFVAQVFSDLRFKLNEEKTYVKEEFRESCGGDYYCGIDVRPFHPEGQSSQLTKQAYLSFLYRMYNGLARRWDKFDLPLSFNYIDSECRRLTDSLHYVPEDFPDHSGIKSDLVYNIATTKVSSSGNVTRHFKYLKQHNPVQKVTYQQFYYWEKLRSLHVSDITSFEESPYYPSTRDILQWIRKPYRSEQRGGSQKPLSRKKLIAFVIKRGHPRVRFVEATGRLFC